MSRGFADRGWGRRRRWAVVRRPWLVTGCVLAVGLSIAGCGVGPTTVANLQRDVAAVFGNSYVVQQRLLGRTVSAVEVAAVASCSRPGRAGGTGGPGDWSCVLQWRPAAVGNSFLPPLRTAAFEVSVRPDGCWSASGPPALVGAAVLVDASGRTVVNPAAAFDGCLVP